MIVYRRDFSKTKFIYLLIKDEKLLEKYNIMKTKFGSNPVYNEKYVKTKMKVYDKKINRDFHSNKMPKESSEFLCLSVILFHSVYIKDNKYYPQVFLEECKYIIKEEKKSLKKLLLTTYKFLLMTLIKKILRKKIKYRITYLFSFPGV